MNDKTRQRTKEYKESIECAGDEQIAVRCGNYRKRTGEVAWSMMGDVVRGKNKHWSTREANRADRAV